MSAPDKSTDIKSALAADLKGCRYSRADVALKLSGLAGRSITEAMVDAFCAQTKPHRFPADLIAGWVQVTGSTRVLEIACAGTGFQVADETTVRLAEYARAQMRAQALKEELWHKVS